MAWKVNHNFFNSGRLKRVAPDSNERSNNQNIFAERRLIKGNQQFGDEMSSMHQGQTEVL